MLRRSLLALIAVSAALPMAAFGQEARTLTPEETDLINAVSGHNSAITTMVGKFLQIDTQGQRIEGIFYLQRPGKIRFRYNPPSREEILSIGNGFYVIDRKEKTQYAYPQDKVPLRQFLDERIDLLHAGLVAIDQSANYLSLTLQDETPAGTIKVALVFDKETQDLVQWVLTNPDGTDLTFSLYDIEKGVEIPPAYFYLNIGDYNQVEPAN
ncbi:MAG: outer-membrane lipoprotein carrier protein LolA [Devosia nanyangense]|uniref:Outer-membrane lipoprotein carrier protein LolA n=1 Tax=Devosia nanyangense TaxID=1228055 RepID=A0A933NYX9_9HYPH|nr:outer-membrane lipoprotein carrier protein LolA [Devosia nanyangense]